MGALQNILSRGLVKELNTLKQQNLSLTNSNRLLQKGQRSPSPRGITSGTIVRNGMFHQVVDPRALVHAANNVWMLAAAIDKIESEVTKEDSTFEPNFNFKCVKCGTEYETKPEVCIGKLPGLINYKCNSDVFREPDPSQLHRIEKLLDHPNSDEAGRIIKTKKDILKDIVFYINTTDDFYIEIAQDWTGAPAELWSLSGEYIRLVDNDKYKREEKFCPRCYESDDYYTDRDLCPKCHGALKETKYVQIDDQDKIIMRWAADEILHSNTRARGNRIYGIPKIYAIWATAQILRWIELYQWSAYSQNKMPDSFVTFPGMSQAEVNNMLNELIEWKRGHPELRKDVFLGAGEAPVHTKLMDTLVDLNAVEMAHYLREAIAIRYGVSLQMLGVQTPGKLGSETEVIEVSYDTIEDIQSQIEEFFNSQLIPLFPEIKDWHWEMHSPKKTDKMREAQIKQTNAQTVAILRGTGAEAILDENFEPIIEKWGDVPSAQNAPMFQYRKSPEGVTSWRNGNNTLHFEVSNPNTNFEKSLTPRNIPADDAVDNIRKIENYFAEQIKQKYQEKIKDLQRKARTLTQAELKKELTKLSNEMSKELKDLAVGYTTDTYTLALDQELKTFKSDIGARFNQVDEGVLEFLRSKPDGIISSLKGFSDNQTNIFGDIIKRAYAVPGKFDLNLMIKEMSKYTDEELYKLERIARSETTRITNTARATQWEKYARPDDKYDWIVARDSRLCPICSTIAKGGTVKVGKKTYTFKGNPYSLDELRKATNDFLPHPNCRCTVGRIILEEV